MSLLWKYLGIYLAFQAPCPGLADLPVHCLAEDAVGTWRFLLSEPSATRSSCGHQHPDDPLQEPRLNWPKNRKPDLSVTVRLPATASLEAADGGPAEGSEGSWAMVGDEGFEVRVAGKQFFSFFGFKKLPTGIGTEHLPLAMQQRYSRCGETMEGWYRSEARDEWGCYVATKVDGAASLLQHRAGRRSLHETLDIASDETGGRSNLDESKSSLRGTQKRDSHKVVDKLSLPAAWDWRNVSGHSWVDPSVSQGICGSCHTISTIQMLSARHRIAKRDPALSGFSIAFPLYCNEYNQGCGAGFPYLAAKWSEDVGLLPDRCAPAYSADSADSGTCSASCEAQSLAPEERLRASGHRYLGGYIGAAEKDDIKDELVRGGPVVVSFRSGHELQEYTGGLFFFDNSGEDPSGNSGEATNNGPQGFVGASHSALLVGYGTMPTGEAYWTLQNSWGTGWGEQGTFRMNEEQARERGMEAMAVAADVISDETGAGSSPGRSQLDQFIGNIGMRASASSASAGSQQSDAAQDPMPPAFVQVANASGGGGLEVLCKAAGDPALVVKIDRKTNTRGISLGDSVGTETKVVCGGVLDTDACAAPQDGDCASMDTCSCDLHGAQLAYAGMQTVVDKVNLMCTASTTPVNVLMIGLGGGAIPSAILDRCAQGQVSVESVELDQRVADIASKFFGFTASDHNSVAITDGLSAVRSRQNAAYDAVLVDCFGSSDRVPEGCRSAEFLREVHRTLKDDGILMQNVWARSAASKDVTGDFEAMKATYASTFGQPALEEVMIDVPESKEEILYGIKGQKWRTLVAFGDDAA